ncbi:MAG: acyloxyacyl hydrolase [Pseudomonadota bacterium]
MRLAGFAIFLFTLMATAPAAAFPAVDEIRGGVFAQGCCGPGVDKEKGAAFNGEIAFKSPEFFRFILSPRPVAGFTLPTNAGATAQVYAGVDWKFDLPKRFYLSAGAGGVVHTGETDAFDPAVDMDRVDDTLFLGCRVQFRVSADGGYRVTDRLDVGIHWSHMSNAGLCSDNEGLDHLGVRVGWRF